VYQKPKRKRFYVGFINGGARQILSLRTTPSKDVYQHSYSNIIGPFKTYNEAMERLLLGE